MIYEMESLAATLKEARGKKNLSQRDLSAISGVPQSHISKIEKAGVDLRVSSLNALANALDLELTLVPRKAIPAVKSIARGSETSPIVPPEVAKQMTRIGKQLESATKLNIDTSAISNLQRHFKELQQLQNLIRDTSGLQRINDLMKSVTESDGIKAAQQAAKHMSEIRNRLAHSVPKIERLNLPRPAYTLDGEDDG